MWEKLYTASTQIGQGVVYFIFQELLNYPQVNKRKRLKKSIISIFEDIQFLIKQLFAAITPNQDI